MKRQTTSKANTGTAAFATGLLLGLCIFAHSQELPQSKQGDYVVHDFRFRSGEVIPDLRLHYYSAGQPLRDAQGHVTNAVMIVHPTTVEGGWYLRNKAFVGELFAPGQVLDANRYYIIAPDAIGHGKSSKPSDGLHAKFPHYDYEDMVEVEHLLLTEYLKVDHLRLFMGMSMGCMHAFILSEKYPDFLDAAMPLACSVAEIGGRNRIFRKVLMDAIRYDPGYQSGEYKRQPAALRTALGMMLYDVSSSRKMQMLYPTGEKADAELKSFIDSSIADSDANDVLYAFDASRDYDPSEKLDQIKAAVMWVNSADDAVNPPELGIPEQHIREIKRGRFVLLPISDVTRGHGTNSYPPAWKQYLTELMNQIEH
jgi:homoserine O-acetyltransferase/O-succinyltransferase